MSIANGENIHLSEEAKLKRTDTRYARQKLQKSIDAIKREIRCGFPMLFPPSADGPVVWNAVLPFYDTSSDYRFEFFHFNISPLERAETRLTFLLFVLHALEDELQDLKYAHFASHFTNSQSVTLKKTTT